MLELKLNHVSKGAPGSLVPAKSVVWNMHIHIPEDKI